jgi:hypothetical protein
MSTRGSPIARRPIKQSLLEGLASGRSPLGPATFFKRMHALVDQIAADQGKRRLGKAGRSPRDQG